ncbi:hypothetical protein [Aliiroseovarius sp. F20344]|uniref:hypothetical protein n=1 Tax=Aliiroseovarius sp. F20344 TaxID=2926414 RepID=UPI001FF4FEFD|nr:hypothetical protein [Aliiroseovarius sp. F20344]MCK0142122.1 hypothetical protein [Aliiroseovarius sp. F20344]
MKIYLLAFASIVTSLAILASTRGNLFDDQASRDRDIAFLVDIHLGHGEFADKSTTFVSQIADKIGSDLEMVGARVIDQELFQTILLGDLTERYETKTRKWIKGLYLMHLNSREIQSLAEYARSDEGRDLLNMTHPLDQKPSKRVAAFFDGPGRPIAERMPALKTDVELFFHEQSILVSEHISMARVADIAERPDVVAFDDESKRAEAVAIMRTLHNEIDYGASLIPN